MEGWEVEDGFGVGFSDVSEIKGNDAVLLFRVVYLFGHLLFVLY